MVLVISVICTMSLTVDPSSATLPAGGGKATHAIKNGGEAKLVFKVRCSNNTDYRVKPVFGFVDAGGSANFDIIRTAGAPKEDKMVIQFAPAPDGASDAQAAWGQVQPAGDVTMPVSAQ